MVAVWYEDMYGDMYEEGKGMIRKEGRRKECVEY